TALGGGTINSNDTEVSYNVEVKSTTYTFDPGEVVVKKGGSTLKFTYTPSINAKDSASTIAYEYQFNNPMSVEQAVNLKSIDSTGVTLSYAYSDTKLSEITSSSSNFELQKISADSSKYIYILVTPTNDEVPATFISSIVWYQGKPGILNVYDSDNTTILGTYNIVKGQLIDESWLSQVEVEIEGYKVEWYGDSAYTNTISSLTRTQGGDLYHRVPNLPIDWLTLDETTNTYYVSKPTSDASTLPNNLVIPTTYNDIDVTYICSSTSKANGVFYNQTSLTSVNLPNTITSIGKYAFYGCTGLSNVNIPNSITTIEAYTFYQCALTSVNLPSSVTTLGTHVFYGCTSLISADLSATTLTSASNYLFYECTSLASVSLPTTIKTIGTYIFHSCSSLTTITLSSNVTSLGNYAFYGCTGLTSIDLTNCTNLTTIGDYAFESCSSLTSITIPSSVTTIGINSFRFSGLTGVYISDIEAWCNISFEDSSSNPLYHAKNLYLNNQLVTNLTIPSTITKIKSFTFCGCDSLTSITLPSSLTSIGSYAFYNCDSLTSITLPSSVTTLGGRAFSYCSSLTSIDLSNCANLTTIGSYAFSSCGLTSVTLPSSVTTIGEDAFRSCSSLTSIVVEEGNNVYDSRNNCNAIIETATNTLIQGCDNTIIPDDIEIIGDYAFSSCTSLTSITLPSSVTTIGKYAFYNCKSLTSITLPSSVTTIGTYAFSACTSLTSIVIPSSVTKIGWFAFYNSGLTSLTIEGWDSGTWYKTNNETNWNNMTNGTKFTGSFADASQNATWFKSNSSYYKYYWYKK
ncbi:MAG: leucine-rich repeat protein, partial [Clostridia bacterium]|nr:leucine-rich repeat protein [Clostridia bacterium]